MFVTKEIKELNITDGAMLEFLKLQEEDYTLCNNGYVLIDRNDNVVGNLLPLISSLDFSYSYVDCEYVDMATITCFDKVLFQLFLTSGIIAKLSILMLV